MGLHLLLWLTQWACTIIGALVLIGWALRGLILGAFGVLDWASDKLYQRQERRRRMAQETSNALL